jgi:hypothetical protein
MQPALLSLVIDVRRTTPGNPRGNDSLEQLGNAQVFLTRRIFEVALQLR